jgi:hypothetical protein
VHDERYLLSAESRLVARFAPEVAPEVVGRTLAQAYAELHDRSTVTTFLAILAERLAAHRLADLASRRPPPEAPTTGGSTPPRARPG